MRTVLRGSPRLSLATVIDRRSRPVFVLLLLFTALLPACTTLPAQPPLPHEPLSASTLAHNNIPCTPLLLLVHAKAPSTAPPGVSEDDSAPGVIGCGSGVLVHPRIILTANHVVPADPTFVVAYDGIEGGSHGEAIVIQRVIRATNAPPIDRAPTERRTADDWSLLILEHPFKTFTHAARASADAPAPGTPITLAGFPFTNQHAEDVEPLARTPMLVHTHVVTPRHAEPGEPSIYYAKSSRQDPNREGASGCPVFQDQTLVGIYLGRIDTETLTHTLLHRELVIQRIPMDAIDTTVREVESTPAPH